MRNVIGLLFVVIFTLWITLQLWEVYECDDDLGIKPQVVVDACEYWVNNLQ